MMISLNYSPSGSKTPLQSFLGISEQHAAPNGVRVSTLPVQHMHMHTTRSFFLMNTVT